MLVKRCSGDHAIEDTPQLRVAEVNQEGGENETRVRKKQGKGKVCLLMV